MKSATVREVFGTGAKMTSARSGVASGESRCPRCPHQLGPHVCVATTDDDPLQGGVMVCHVKLCPCYGTWSVPQLGSNETTIRRPDTEELAKIMLAVQTTDPGAN